LSERVSTGSRATAGPASLAVIMLGTALAIVALTRARSGDYQGIVELFWVGMVPAAIAAWYGCWQSESRHWTVTLLATFAVALYSVKVFRSPFFLGYHDELAHFRSLTDFVVGLGLNQANPLIPIVQGYPGLHALTGGLALMTGLSPLASAFLIIGIVHTLLPMLVFEFARYLTGSLRVGAVAALVYMTNPSFIYFDSQFA
jgi:hypothetical protein